MYVPRVLACREGDELTVKNTAAFAHNAKYSSSKNGEGNPLVAAGGKYTMPTALTAEKNPISLSCSIHGWMQAYVMVYDHPYYATTGKDGTFEIKMAPVGKFKLYVRHESGFNGGVKGALKPEVIELKPGQDLDLGTIEFSSK